MTNTDKVILKSLDCIMQFLYVAHSELYSFGVYQTLADQMKETHEYIKEQEEMGERENKAETELNKLLLKAVEEMRFDK